MFSKLKEIESFERFNFYPGHQSNYQAKKISTYWYNFSKFVPSFLTQLDENISTPIIKERIQSIVLEEIGDGVNEHNHSALFKDAMGEVGIEVNEIEVLSIQKLNEVFQNELREISDKEAYSVGLSYGLEIIAEENILHLLKSSASNDLNYNILKNTLFFKIHLQNEIEHILKCRSNKKIICTSLSREKVFFEGKVRSLDFWKSFWDEAHA